MAHPQRGTGSYFGPIHTFAEAYTYVGIKGISFHSTTNEEIYATQSLAADNHMLTIIFRGERSRHGNVCEVCWGYRINCSQTRIGQCAEALDKEMSKGQAVGRA